ncbi:MAG: hypothetical protein JWO59_2348 [Chloroflexi bacterium]|jgi:gas vesicle protein|nr:hypothetical protein [Chloroflexota bacterium]MDB5077813.1 hypothetical protein [Chloroflexota bacterium]
MARSTTGQLFSGLFVGAAIGASVALALSSRTSVAVPGARSGRRSVSTPTPFEPANAVINRARTFVHEVRSQVRQAVEEGRATAAQTRQELTARFEAAKRAPQDGEKP